MPASKRHGSQATIKESVRVNWQSPILFLSWGGKGDRCDPEDVVSSTVICDLNDKTLRLPAKLQGETLMAGHVWRVLFSGAPERTELSNLEVERSGTEFLLTPNANHPIAPGGDVMIAAPAE